MSQKRHDANLDPMTKGESAAWSKIEQSFGSAKLIGPSRGFASRWLLVQREQELAERKRREVWLAFGNGAAILVILGVIAITMWPLFSQPATLFASALESLLDGLTFFIVWIGVGLSLFQKFSAVAWFMMAFAFFGLVALWTSLFSRVVEIHN